MAGEGGDDTIYFFACFGELLLECGGWFHVCLKYFSEAALVNGRLELAIAQCYEGEPSLTKKLHLEHMDATQYGFSLRTRFRTIYCGGVYSDVVNEFLWYVKSGLQVLYTSDGRGQLSIHGYEGDSTWTIIVGQGTNNGLARSGRS